jgi:hypothetical protein
MQDTVRDEARLPRRGRCCTIAAVSDATQVRESWAALALALDGEVKWDAHEIVSLSRVSPWKIDFPAAAELAQPPRVRTRLTAFGEPRSKRFAIYRDSLSRAVLPVPKGAPVKSRRWSWGKRIASPYSLSQFMVDVAPRWVDAAPRAAIVVTDHGAADWILVEPDHVQLGWERGEPTIDQLKLSIGTLQELLAIPRSTLPFR